MFVSFTVSFHTAPEHKYTNTHALKMKILSTIRATAHQLYTRPKIQPLTDFNFPTAHGSNSKKRINKHLGMLFIYVCEFVCVW